MLLNDEVKMLRQVPIFAGMAAAKLRLLAYTSDRVAYRSGEVLFHQGDDGDAAYVILQGQADVMVTTPQGELRVAQVAENAMVGEIAILCDVARTATVRAVTPVEALRISKENFVKLLMDFPEMTLEIVRVLAARLSDTTATLSAELAAARHSANHSIH
ncbi:Cyclic nucleotide-binding domain-containing protein [Loktanella atrilutea]|uniref:Cyclic nucleotide-binding domain-containing protein n=1 Tax=Loktanella atrilutea TaxID=366533 RepID=A0A1M4YTN1_LOKAT|nr:cyclic nucleotide-binding domain-containing protein [Loktanella atrilutea]SHF09073.1 Cyclic nucleotide-binding domain-containing protein [Loktanella atrilutea]